MAVNMAQQLMTVARGDAWVLMGSAWACAAIGPFTSARQVSMSGCALNFPELSLACLIGRQQEGCHAMSANAWRAGELQKDVLFLHRASSYLFGRERKVVDVATDHPSCSKQHAVLQYRQVPLS